MKKSGIRGFSFYGISVSQTGLMRPVKGNQMKDFKSRWCTKPLASRRALKEPDPWKKCLALQGDVV